MLRYFLLSFLIIACWGCRLNAGKEKALQAKIDSLQNIIDQNRNISKMLGEIGAMIDSIDYSTRLVDGNIDNAEGSYEEIVGRMKAISKFVKASQEKIAELDNKILRSGQSYKEYASVIRNLETSLESRNIELSQLQKHAERYKNQNQNLMHLVDLQKSEIEDKLVQLQIKQAELVSLQEGVDRLLSSSADERAQNCFIRAQLLEEVAERTKLAPRKKRNTRLEALELYKMASFYGNTEANAKISELEKKI